MSALAAPYPDDDPRSPAYVDVEIRMPPERERAPISILQSAAQRRANASCDRLLATIRLINRTPEECLRAAGARLAWERQMGLQPRRGYVTAIELHRHCGAVFDRARRGEHIIVTEHERPAAVIVDAAEYEQLLDDRRQWEAMTER
jgi:prevent-host-death family protein